MRAQLLTMLTLAAFSASPCFPANILISGNAMNQSDTTLTGNLSELTGANTLTFVSPINFAATALAGYDLVWLDGFSQYLNLSSLLPYLNSGGKVLIQNPGFGSEPMTAYPHAAGLVAAFVFGDTVHITAPSDFMDAGLTDAALSNWNPSYYGHFTTTTGAFLSLSNTGTPGQDVTIRDTSDPGTLVYTEQGIAQYLSSQSFSADAAPLQFLDNLIGAPEPGTAPLLLLALGALSASARKLRTSR